jgi:TP901 family phage tail tape measure protein
MADATGHIRVETIIDQSLQAGLNQLSASIGATTGRITALNSVSRRLSESSRGLNASLKFLGETERGVHSITQALAVSQTTLASHFAQVRREANAFNAVLRSNSSASKANASAISNNVAKIRQMNSAQATLNTTMRAGAMMNMSKQYNKQATELSYVGQRLTMGLTLPLMAVGRIGFSSLKKLDQEMIRTRKLLNDTGMDAIVLEGRMKVLGDRLDKISFKWGVSRELLQGLAGDFAELGITSPNVLANLVQITNEIEKLGNVDMTEANDLTRSIYQNLLKLRRVNDQDVTSDAALETVTSQVRGAIALFNFAENKTSLSLKDIAQAFPEVQAAATTFGLSMQTTAALLVPMVSAGIKTGTAANALKVSLQKLIIPTKDVRKIYAALNQELGEKFPTSMEIGTKGIQQLVDAFRILEDSSYGTMGTLQLFAKAFGVRQGTRMDLAVQQFAAFQTQIEKTDEAMKKINKYAEGSVESKLLASLEREVNMKLKAAKIDEIRLSNIEEIGRLNEMATETERTKDRDGNLTIEGFTKRAQAIQEAQKAMLGDKKNQKKISEQINLISTESGKILIGGAIGQGLMEETMNEELKAVENSLNVQAGKVREAMKSIARDSTVAFGSVLTTIGPALQKIAIFIKNLSPGTKKLIGFFALFL